MDNEWQDAFLSDEEIAQAQRNEWAKVERDRIDIEIGEADPLPTKCLRCGAEPAPWIDVADIPEMEMGGTPNPHYLDYLCANCAPICICCGSFVHRDAPQARAAWFAAVDPDFEERHAQRQRALDQELLDSLRSFDEALRNADDSLRKLRDGLRDSLGDDFPEIDPSDIPF